MCGAVHQLPHAPSLDAQWYCTLYYIKGAYTAELRMCGAVPQLPHAPSLDAQWYSTLYYIKGAYTAELRMCGAVPQLSRAPSLDAQWYCKFRVCQSAHHHTFNWINQPDTATSQIYYLSFKYSSTCFGHPHAHHQELQQLQ